MQFYRLNIVYGDLLSKLIQLITFELAWQMKDEQGSIRVGKKKSEIFKLPTLTFCSLFLQFVENRKKAAYQEKMGVHGPL